MEVDLYNTYDMKILKMTIVMMMMMTIAETQSIFKLGPSYFSWK